MLQCFTAAIPYYSLLTSLLSQLLFIAEFALDTVILGEHLWTILNHLEQLTKQHKKRIDDEQENGIRRQDADRFILRHLNISVPGRPLLQRDVNLEAARHQCVLVSGPSGCGKTSLFRICAGLQLIDAAEIVLPARRHLLFIPQRPYLPIGSLRVQALLLVKDRSAINDHDLYRLFQSVNLMHLLRRYSFEAVSALSRIVALFIDMNYFSRLLIGRWYFLWVSNSVYRSFAY